MHVWLSIQIRAFSPGWRNIVQRTLMTSFLTKKSSVQVSVFVQCACTHDTTSKNYAQSPPPPPSLSLSLSLSFSLSLCLPPPFDTFNVLMCTIPIHSLPPSHSSAVREGGAPPSPSLLRPPRHRKDQHHPGMC